MDPDEPFLSRKLSGITSHNRIWLHAPQLLHAPYTMGYEEVVSARMGIVRLFALCLGTSVIVAYTNDSYLRDAYK
jgi:hypothetical protein